MLYTFKKWSNAGTSAHFQYILFKKCCPGKAKNKVYANLNRFGPNICINHVPHLRMIRAICVSSKMLITKFK